MASDPARGEVWLVTLDPTVGDEMQKTRRVVVLSSDDVGLLDLKVIVPVTAWQAAFANRVWMVPLRANAAHGLAKDSAADAYQIRSVSNLRFVRRLGQLPESLLDDIAVAVAICIQGPTQFAPVNP